METTTCRRAVEIRRMTEVLTREETDRLEAVGFALRRQAADLAAAEYRWLVLLEEFDRGGGWALEGAKSCAGWLVWACGTNPNAARERVRVARALADLPIVSDRMAAGTLSYSKARAITRVATPENEELLVTYAESATAAQLEDVIRGYRRNRQADEDDEAPEAADLAHRERRECSWWVDDDGYLRLSGRWPVEEGMLIVNVMEKLADDLGEQPADAADSDGEPDPALGCGDRPVALKRCQTPEPAAVRRADALVRMAEAAATAEPASRSGDDRYLVNVIVRESTLSGEGDNEAVTEERDPATGASPAATGTSAAVDGAPAAITSASAAEGAVAGRGGHPLLMRPDAPRVRPDPPARVEDAGGIASETARRLACDTQLVVLVEDALGRPLGVGRRSRTVPRWLRRQLKRRDGGCRFPGCTTTRHVDAHHIWFWGEGGPTDLDNLLLLCRFHHTLVHEGGFSIALTAPGRFTFHRPDGSLVTPVAGVEAGDADRLVRDNLLAGAAPTADSLVPDWDGTRQDIDAAIEVLYLTTHGFPDDPAGVSAETSSGSGEGDVVAALGEQRARDAVA